jgi:hypothetical protein
MRAGSAARPSSRFSGPVAALYQVEQFFVCVCLIKSSPGLPTALLSCSIVLWTTLTVPAFAQIRVWIYFQILYEDILISTRFNNPIFYLIHKSPYSCTRFFSVSICL